MYRQSLELNTDLWSPAATQAKRTATSDLRHCATRAGRVIGLKAQSFISRLYLAPPQGVTLSEFHEGVLYP